MWQIHFITVQAVFKMIAMLTKSPVTSPGIDPGRSRDRFPVVSLGIFSVVPSDKTMCSEVNSALKMSTRYFSWGKGGRCVRLTTYHPRSAEHRDDPGP